uniref:Secreted protein n=1 Tax=Cucumis melo TaxID=3656 RepID=A0A9I9E623_CUCME
MKSNSISAIVLFVFLIFSGGERMIRSVEGQICQRILDEIGLAPLSRSRRATSSCPASTARRSGVYPALSMASASAPTSSSAFTHSTLPLNAALCRAVHPFWSFPFTFAPAATQLLRPRTSPALAVLCNASSNLNESNRSVCPFSDASANAVLPSEFTV